MQSPPLGLSLLSHGRNESNNRCIKLIFSPHCGIGQIKNKITLLCSISFWYAHVPMWLLTRHGCEKVTPTLVTGRRFTISFNDMAPGNYNLLLNNAFGRQVYKTIIKNAGENNSRHMELGKAFITAGIYNLSVSNGGGIKQNSPLCSTD